MTDTGMEVAKLAFANCLPSPFTSLDRCGYYSRLEQGPRDGVRRSSFLISTAWHSVRRIKPDVSNSACVPRMTLSRDAEIEIDNNAQLDATLDALAKKMSVVPEAEDKSNGENEEELNVSAEVAAKLGAMQSVMGIPLESSNLEFSTIEEQIVHSLTSESHALATYGNDFDDFESANDELLLSSFMDENSSYVAQNEIVHDDDEDESSKGITIDPRKYQANPRELNGTQLHLTREAIQRRRKHLAAEHGEYTLRNPEFDIGALESDSVIMSPHALTVNSLRNAHPFAPHSLQNSTDTFGDNRKEDWLYGGGGSLVTAAAQHVSMGSRAPMAYRPFPGLQEAFYFADNPPCQRCTLRAHYTQLAANAGICSSCYAEIYLHTPPNDLLTENESGFVSPGQARLDEIRLAHEAVQVVQNFAMSGTTSDNLTSPSTSPPSTPSSPTSVIPGGRGGEFDGPVDGGGVYNGSISNSSFDYADGWQVAASARSLRTINPIRNLVQNIQVKPNPEKKQIKLSIGDPTVYGNLEVSDKVIDTLARNLKERVANGYSLSMGTVEARNAIAERYSTKRSPLTADDIFLTSGTSGALELVLGALANEGDNILLPRPGFPLFRTLAENLGIECRFYQLDPDREWQAELGDISSNTDQRTRAIVVNNPSNPCGSVFSPEHIDDIISVASALRVPIIADEVYANMVFSPASFTSFGEASTDVPVLAVGGVSKQFVVPGWRLGWVLVHDRNKVLERAGVLKGMRQLTTRMLVPNTPAQTVLPTMLSDTSGFDAVMAELCSNAEFAMEQVQKIPGLTMIRPSGAMYMMVHVDVQKMGLKDDMDFVEKLLEEEAVFALPGKCFQAPNFVRIVFAAPKKVLGEAFERMEAFCTRRISRS